MQQQVLYNFILTYNGLPVDYMILSDGNYLFKRQIPTVIGNLLNRNVVEFPIKMYIVDDEGKKTDYFVHKTFEKLVQYYEKSIENNSDFLQKKVIQIHIRHYKQRVLENKTIEQ